MGRFLNQVISITGGGGLLILPHWFKADNQNSELSSKHTRDTVFDIFPFTLGLKMYYVLWSDLNVLTFVVVLLQNIMPRIYNNFLAYVIDYLNGNKYEYLHQSVYRNTVLSISINFIFFALERKIPYVTKMK